MTQKIFSIAILSFLMFAQMAGASEYIGTLSAGGDGTDTTDSFPTPTFAGDTNTQVNQPPASQSPSTQFSFSSIWNTYRQSLLWAIIIAAVIIAVFLLLFYRVARRRNPPTA